MTTKETNPLTERIIGLAIEVHRNLGPGLLESLYESALCFEFESGGLQYERQKMVPLSYKGRVIGDYKIDLLVEKAVVLELKSVDRHDAIFEAQILSYLKISGVRTGLLINFNTRLLKDGVKRFML